ncbi:MAG: hypothetical protein ACFE7E_01320 [Candidatus Hodarchaeota archaeon]
MKNRAILLFSICTALGVLLIFFGIATLTLKILFTVTFIVLIVLFMTLLLNIGIPLRNRFSLHMNISKRLLLFFIFTAITSLAVVFMPKNPVTISSEHIFETFILMSPLQLFELVSACFLTTFAPGYLIVEYFLRSWGLDRLGKIGVSLALSYCISNVMGTFLVTTGVLTPLTYVIGLWILIATISSLRFRTLKKNRYLQKSNASRKCNPVSFNLHLLTFVILTVVMVTSYYVISVPGPLGGYTRWDVYEYMRIANNFAVSDVTWEPYLGFPLFFYIVSRVAYIPMLYVYAALQYYSILLFLSIYVLIKTLFPKNTKTPYYALLILLMGKISSVYFLYNIFTNTQILALYTTSTNKFDLLTSYGAGGMLFTVYGHLFTLSLVIFGIVFGYRYLNKMGNSAINLLLTALFAGVSLYSHNIMETAILLCSLLILSLYKKRLKGFSKVLVASVLLTLALEPLYKFFLAKYVWLRVSQLQFSYSALWLIPVFFIIMDVGIFFVIMKDSIIPKFKSIGQKIHSWLPKVEDVTIRIISSAIIFLAIIAALLAYFLGQLNLPNINVDIYAIMPSWWYVVNAMVPIGIIAGIPLRNYRNGLGIVIAFIAALLLLSLLGVFLPAIFWRNLWTHRLLSRIDIPLIMFAAIKLDSIKTDIFHASSKIYKVLGYLRPASVILLLSISYVSYGHSIEAWSNHPINTIVSVPMGEGINWVNSYLGADAIIFAPNFETPAWGDWHQKTPYKTLCALVIKPTVMYFSESYELIEYLDATFDDKAGSIFIFIKFNDPVIFDIESIAPYYNVSRIFQNLEVNIYKVETHPAS